MSYKYKKAFALAGVLAVVASAILVPSAAFAQSSTEGYGGDNRIAGLEQSGGGGGNGPAESNSSPKASSPSNTVTKSSGEGTLPFTGADLGIVAAAGAMLFGFGFGLRRLAHPPTQA
jgi:hypothetical protein